MGDLLSGYEDQVEADDDGLYRAAATNVQVIALGHSLRPEVATKQVRRSIDEKLLPRAANADFTSAVRWCSNAWSTERLLRVQTEMNGDVQRLAVQWAFPQAYYACFCQLLGLFAVVGHSEKTHSGVIRRFGTLAKESKLPDCLAAFADGGRNEIVVTGPRKGKYPSPTYLELHEPASVENQVAQLLTSTRKKALEDKKSDFKFMTTAGVRKKSLNRKEWATVSDKLGPTTALSYLYRKRIKANYRDIDSLLHSEIDGAGILQGLSNIVAAFALFCEGYLDALAKEEERALLSTHLLSSTHFVRERRETLRRKL